MINSNCPLSDKDKLDATLHSECRFQNQLPKNNTYCFDCPYENPTLIKQIENAIIRVAERFIFEPINDTTKRRITAEASTVLKQFRTTKRIHDYNVTSDNTNTHEFFLWCEIVLRR